MASRVASPLRRADRPARSLISRSCSFASSRMSFAVVGVSRYCSHHSSHRLVHRVGELIDTLAIAEEPLESSGLHDPADNLDPRLESSEDRTSLRSWLARILPMPNQRHH